MERLLRLVRELSAATGQTMAEYGLILAGVFLTVALAVLLLGDPVTGLISGVVNAFP